MKQIQWLTYGETVFYRIKIKGELDERWSEYFGNIRVSSEKDEMGFMLTTLEMDATDQSALFGLLNHLQDLNLSLISVTSNNKEDTERNKSTRDKNSRQN